MVALLNKILLLFISVLLVSCTARPLSVQAKYQPLFDFNNVQSYSLYNRDQPFNEFQSLSDAVRNDIELAIERAMEQQGYQFKTQQKADVILTYYWLKQDVRAFKIYNNGVYFCAYCLNHAKSDTKADRLNIKSNTLIIDVLNRKTKRSVWRSFYPLPVKPKENSQQVQRKVHQAVSLMLAKFANQQ